MGSALPDRDANETGSSNHEIGSAETLCQLLVGSEDRSSAKLKMAPGRGVPPEAGLGGVFRVKDIVESGIRVTRSRGGM